MITLWEIPGRISVLSIVRKTFVLYFHRFGGSVILIDKALTTERSVQLSEDCILGHAEQSSQGKTGFAKDLEQNRRKC